jgi:hypothetical protein
MTMGVVLSRRGAAERDTWSHPMGIRRIGVLRQIGVLGRGLAATAVAAVLAGSGPVAAAARPDVSAVPRGGPAAGTISTVAGGVGGLARAAQINLGTAGVGVAFGGGSLYVGVGATVRKVAPATDRLTTAAGTGGAGPLGDGGPAVRASLNGATAVTVDPSGNVLIAETGHERIRVIAASTGTFYGQTMAVGHIYTVAGNGRSGFSGDGGAAAAARLNTPQDLGVDGAGNVVIADRLNNRIRMVTG